MHVTSGTDTLGLFEGDKPSEATSPTAMTVMTHGHRRNVMMRRPYWVQGVAMGMMWVRVYPRKARMVMGRMRRRYGGTVTVAVAVTMGMTMAVAMGMTMAVTMVMAATMTMVMWVVMVFRMVRVVRVAVVVVVMVVVSATRAEQRGAQSTVASTGMATPTSMVTSSHATFVTSGQGSVVQDGLSEEWR